MEEWLSRTSLLVGEEALARLQQSHVLVVGVGGVGAYAAEMIVRAGVGRITLLDADEVEASNLNRQLVALCSTLGRPKVDVLRQRLLDINPHLHIEACARYLEAGDVETLLDGGFDFVVDAIDTLAPKVALLAACVRRQVPVISSMGAGARLDPAAVAYADISKTSRCGLAREVRRRLRAAGIERGVAVVYSTEEPVASAIRTVEGERNKRSVTGTVSYLPALFGCYLAAHVIRQLSEA